MVGATLEFGDGCGDDVEVALASHEVGRTLRLFMNPKFCQLEHKLQESEIVVRNGKKAEMKLRKLIEASGWV